MRSYEEIAESLLRRRDEYIENQRVRRNIMKKRIIALSAFCLAVLIGIGVWQADLFKTKPIETPIDSTSSKQEAQTENPVESTPVESEQPSTPQTTEQPEPPAIGGDGATWALAEYTDSTGGYMIHSFPYDYLGEFVDQEVVNNWYNQFWSANKESYTRTDAISIIKFLDEVGGITKEEFMTIDYYDELTQEEIDLIFSDDHALRDQSLLSPYAVFSNEKIYTPYWFDSNDAQDYIAAGMTKSQLLEKVPLWREKNKNNKYINLDRIIEEIDKMP